MGAVDKGGDHEVDFAGHIGLCHKPGAAHDCCAFRRIIDSGGVGGSAHNRFNLCCGSGEDQHIGNTLQLPVGDKGQKICCACPELMDGGVEPSVATGLVKHPQTLPDLSTFCAGRKLLHAQNDLSNAGFRVILGKVKGRIALLGVAKQLTQRLFNARLQRRNAFRTEQVIKDTDGRKRQVQLVDH